MNGHRREGLWGFGAILLGMGLTAVMLMPNESWADPRTESYSSHHGEHKRDFAGRTFRALLRDQQDLHLSPDQVGKIEALATDYARTRIRNEAAEQLAEVDVRALIRNEQSDISAIEAALRKSESAQTTARLDRVKAIRAGLAVLTPEQRDLWRAKMREHHREGRHGRALRNEPDGHEQMNRAG